MTCRNGSSYLQEPDSGGGVELATPLANIPKADYEHARSEHNHLDHSRHSAHSSLSFLFSDRLARTRRPRNLGTSAPQGRSRRFSRFGRLRVRHPVYERERCGDDRERRGESAQHGRPVRDPRNAERDVNLGVEVEGGRNEADHDRHGRAHAVCYFVRRNADQPERERRGGDASRV